MKAVIEIHMRVVFVANRTLHLVFDGRSRATARLRGNYFASAEPAGEQIEKVHTMLDENPTAFRAIPEPMLRWQILVRRVVFEIPVQKFTQQLLLNQPADHLEQRVV